MLNGEKIHLRLFEENDLTARVQWINDKEINQTLGFDWPVSVSKTRAWFQNALSDHSKIHFAIVDNESNKLIGMAGLLSIDYKNSNAEFYITIGEKEFWGQRISDEVIFLILEYAFIELGLKKIYLHTFDYNVKAQRVYERNGFTREGVFRKHKWKRGALRDIIYYGILKEEWDQRRKNK